MDEDEVFGFGDFGETFGERFLARLATEGDDLDFFEAVLFDDLFDRFAVGFVGDDDDVGDFGMIVEGGDWIVNKRLAGDFDEGFVLV